ncbi:tyrosine-type recombinase/integrase [Chitinimonas taiwanensis]|uniref:tyrosine-type recombinase/integrase n=1 Tax=Chitinimonas taiwanensis TaxID=240412 RepID=UPI0035B4A898
MALDYLTEAQQRQLLKTIRSRSGHLARRDAAWVALLIETGLRIGEFAQLTVADARTALKTGWLFVPAEYRKGVQVVRKGQKQTRRFDHKVSLYQPERAALAELLLVHELMVDGQQELFDTSPLIYSRNAAPLSVRSYQARLQEWCALAGLAVHASPHTLRHTCAMNILRVSTADNPLSLVTLKLGHVNHRTALIYIEMRDQERVQAELDKVGEQRSQAGAKPRIRTKALRGLFDSRSTH